ncbi:MAG: alanine racemase [Deltaproteobacteria bacterium]|nr:MAG: alanine racemase [Deltaproteobacteria bacterium]
MFAVMESTTTRASAVTVDLDALGANLSVVRQRLRPGCGVLAVVKADAYGHGGRRVAARLSAEGVEGFGVATVAEAMELRSTGLRERILVFGDFDRREIADALLYGIELTLFHEDQIRRVEAAELAGDVPLRVQINVDTGMGRLGILPEDLGTLVARISRARPRIEITGIYSHLATSERLDDPGTEEQCARFERVLQAAQRGIGGRYCRHLLNSAGIWTLPQAHYDFVRPGLALYGALLEPAASAFRPPLTPILRWETRIVHLKRLPRGASVSYGRSFVCPTPRRIAVIPVGYADGLLRAASGRAFVLVRGRRAPLVGTITMDMSMVDVTEIPGVTLGDEVVLLGRQGDEVITPTEMARWAGTIPYEVLCAISPRIERRYRESPRATEQG